MATGSVEQPQLAEHFYLFKDILKIDPKKCWRFCQKLQEKWRQDFSKDEMFSEKMVHFKKVSALTLVWVTDKLSGNLPDDINQRETYRLLSELYDSPDCNYDDGPVPDSTPTNAEKDRATQFQLRQHLFALKCLLQAAEENKDLSEDLIKDVHRELMKDLKTEKGEAIKAGEYRMGPVSAGNHSFPDHECISGRMKAIVADYNRKLRSEHDMFQLASWLLYRIVSLHPFDDGNGRISRLLWCYSLVRDGLPFPLTLSDGHEEAHDHYVTCVKEDRRKLCAGRLNPYLTAITVVSVKEKWENFISNLEFEYPDGYERITQLLEENDLIDIKF